MIETAPQHALGMLFMGNPSYEKLIFQIESPVINGGHQSILKDGRFDALRMTCAGMPLRLEEDTSK
jgi:hypothetical protein